MTQDVDFSSLEFNTENGEKQSATINHRWNFEDTHDGWSWQEFNGSVSTSPIINSVNATSGASVDVTGIIHPTPSEPDGKYFFFSSAQWNALAGNTTWSGNHFTIKQYRSGVLIWEGLVIAWNSGNGVHGRRVAGSSGGQWQVNDIIRGGASRL